MELPLPDIEDTPTADPELDIEKPKKPHGNKGRPMSATSKANLKKGRDKLIAGKEAKMKVAEEKEVLYNMVKEKAVALATPPKPKLKRAKQVIVIQSDSDSDDNTPQIVIRHKKTKPRASTPIPERAEEEEPMMFYEPEPRFRLKRV